MLFSAPPPPNAPLPPPVVGVGGGALGNLGEAISGVQLRSAQPIGTFWHFSVFCNLNGICFSETCGCSFDTP